MSTHLRIAAFSCAILLVAVTTSDSAIGIKMEVSPMIARAPALLKVRVMLNALPDDRTLHVVAESPTYYRASEIQLDGDQSQALNVFEFRDLPTGMYHLTAVIHDGHGPRATAWRIAKVEPGFGSN
jgi:hypothetical protein